MEVRVQYCSAHSDIQIQLPLRQAGHRLLQNVETKNLIANIIIAHTNLTHYTAYRRLAREALIHHSSRSLLDLGSTCMSYCIRRYEGDLDSTRPIHYVFPLVSENLRL